MGVPGGQAASGPQREPHSMRMAGEARRKLREACFNRRVRPVGAPGGFMGESRGFMGVPGGQAASGPQREPHSMRMAGEARRKLREACFNRRVRPVGARGGL